MAGINIFINLIVLRAIDLDRSRSFYEMLGLEFKQHSHGSGPEHLSAIVGRCVFELYPLTTDARPTTSTRIGFCMPCIDDIYKKLLEIGGQVMTFPKDSQWGRRGVILDPDGHVVELLEYSEPSFAHEK